MTVVTTFVGRLLRVRAFRRTLGVLLHLVMALFSSWLAMLLRFDGDIPPENWQAWVGTLPWLAACRALLFAPFGLYEGLWRYTGIWDLRNIVAGVTTSSVVAYLITHHGLGLTRYPRSVIVMDTVLLIVMMSGVRLTRRIHRDIFRRQGRRRVLVFGAGDAAELVVRDIRHNPGHDAEPIGFVDDDPEKVGRRIHGVRVLGTGADVPRLLATYEPDEVLVAVPSATPEAMRRIVRLFEQSKVRITTLPSLAQLLGRPVDVGQIRPLQVEDLLPRAPIGLDLAPVKALIANRRVLVTGAGGSIGSEICHQAVALGVSHLTALDRYENSLFALQNSLADRGSGADLAFAIGDITDQRRLHEVMRAYRPEIVFHAAAHKHVPLMETSPCEAVKNNVTGTRMVAEAAAAHGVSRFIFISTDKAVNPTSVMGVSKRVAEHVVRDVAARSPTRFTVVRFGNVLGSNGSVVPRFVAQIKAGGPVTVTHPDVRRYFMLIPEAVQLVLHAAALDDRGCVYVLEMGEQIKVVEIARDMIRLAGYVPDAEIEIAFIGLRPGEKLSEELVGADEFAEAAEVSKIMRVQSRPDSPVPAAADIRRLEELAVAGDTAGVLEILRRIVPAYAGAEAASIALASSGDRR